MHAPKCDDTFCCGGGGYGTAQLLLRIKQTRRLLSTLQYFIQLRGCRIEDECNYRVQKASLATQAPPYFMNDILASRAREPDPEPEPHVFGPLEPEPEELQRKVGSRSSYFEKSGAGAAKNIWRLRLLTD